MEKNNYSIDKNCLIIRTECGEYRFKINGDTELANAQRIADVMVSEMEKVEKKFHTASKNSNSYTKLLLSNLNISDRFIQLEHKYNHLLKEHEEMKKLYQRRSKSDNAHTQRLEKDKIFHKAKASNNAEPFKIKKEVESNKEALPEKQHPSAQALTQSPTQRAAHEPAKPEPQAKPLEKTLPSVQTPAQTPVKELSTIKKQTDEPVQEQAKQAIPPHPEPQAKPLEKPLAHEPAMPEPPVEPPIEPLEKPQVEPLSQLRINTPEKNLTNSIELGNNYSDEFQLPSLDFLKKADMEIKVDHEAIRRDAELLEQKLGYFGIKGEVMEVSPGPVITTFEYKPAPGIKISKIVNLADDLALALSALSIRILAPIPGKDVIGVEIPNAKMSIVPFIDIVGSDEFLNIDSNIPVCLGKDIIGNAVVVELEKMPHLLIAGATGTGKSVGLNAMIASILYKSSPDKVKFIMIDPKRIELSLFNDIPHLLTPVITDMKKANTALQWVVREMERRYEMLARLQVRNIDQYNHKITTADMSEYDEDETFEEFAYIVIIIDELADLMMTASKDIEFSLTRIAQMARAAGIHLILATQRPSVDVLTGIIKANFPTRISFQVSSKTDSRTIIDANGAETLLGRGDMLFVPPGTARLTRVHGTYLSEDELITITNFLKAQGKPRYVLDVTTEKEEEPAVDVSSNDDYDEKYQAALEYILATRQASISSVQRALRVGYNRAARIIDLMEKKGIIGPSDGVKPRQVLIDRME
ncbi:MAG: DNA translocase FtsK [Thermodesulfobacteriota bacterium]|nr:DNA translocase FtsK [Thermodesulfobacteriota bacterium]